MTILRRRKNITRMLIILLPVSFFGCAMSVPQARFIDIPQVPASQAKGKLSIGPFLDKREDIENLSSEYLGTVRGGFGNVLMRVKDSRGADEFVRDQMINVARASSFMAASAPDAVSIKDDGSWEITGIKQPSFARPVLAGVINKLSVEVLMQRTVEMDIDIALIDPIANKPVLKQKMTAHDSSGMGSGILEDVEKLKSWMAKVVQDEALKYFTSVEFQEALSALAKQTDDQGRFAVTGETGAVAPAEQEELFRTGDFFYSSRTGYQKMNPVGVTSETSHRRLGIPIAGAILPPEDFYFISGEHASLSVPDKKPVFYTRFKPSLIKLVQLDLNKKENKRFVIFENFKSERQLPFESESVNESIYKLAPTAEFKPGEYAFIVGGKDITAFDFEIRP